VYLLCNENILRASLLIDVCGTPTSIKWFSSLLFWQLIPSLFNVQLRRAGTQCEDALQYPVKAAKWEGNSARDNSETLSVAK
jgi:hypothetical protein